MKDQPPNSTNILSIKKSSIRNKEKLCVCHWDNYQSDSNFIIVKDYDMTKWTKHKYDRHLPTSMTALQCPDSGQQH